jgi:lysozyme
MLKQTLFFFFLFFCLVVVLIKTQRRTTSRVRNHQDPWQMASDFDVRGLDLSHHNGKILYEELDTLDFVFLKATEGTTHIDRDFETHYKGFKNKGIALGVYHFFRFDTDGKEQANHFLNRIKGHTFQVPLIVDVEHENNPKVRREKVIQRLNEFMQTIKKKTGQKPIIYTNGDGYSDFVEKEFDDHTLWLSSTNAWRPAMMDCTFWQFNINADLMEITHRADLNVFRGSREEWEGYLKKHKPYTIL